MPATFTPLPVTSGGIEAAMRNTIHSGKVVFELKTSALTTVQAPYAKAEDGTIVKLDSPQLVNLVSTLPPSTKVAAMLATRQQTLAHSKTAGSEVSL